jgi:putative DNA primase/helicase
LTKATKAAKSIKADLAVPEFTEDERTAWRHSHNDQYPSDVNDLAALHGLDAVRAAINNASNGKQPESAKAGDGHRREDDPALDHGATVDDDDAPIKGLDPYRNTDLANAELFIALHGKDVRYVPPWAKWLLWTGSHWRLDEALHVNRLAAGVTRSLYRQAADIEETPVRRKVAVLAKALESGQRQAAMLTAVMPHVVIHHSDLDQGHFLLNARNGTIDLRTGKLRPHERADWLTHDTEIPYHPDATGPTWLLFLDGIFAGDADLIRFVQRAIGIR